MSSDINSEVVKYSCTCGLLKPITKLYFCRHCLELRCAFCVCHEVDSRFCGKCAENLPSSEARLKKNRCANCYDCPSCYQQLTTRAVSVSPKNPEDPKATPRKEFYLICLFCRWSTRDVGIPDQTAVSGGWPERENVHSIRLQDIQEMYKGMVLLQKQQKLDKDKKKQHRYMSFTDRTGVSASMLRKRLGLPDVSHPLLTTKSKMPDPSPAVDEIEAFPEDLLTETVNLFEVTTLEQRLAQPDLQPATVDKLFPIHKQLSVKTSQRCRTCEHNVSKPEYNPASIKFKIQLFAYYYIPEIRIVTVEPLRAGKVCEVLLKFSNPTQHQTTITLLPYADEAEVLEEPKSSTEETASEEKAVQSGGSQPSSLIQTNLSRQPSSTVKPRPIAVNSVVDISIPASTFILLHRDDAAEYDDSGETHNIQDDSKLVMWRKSNKAVIKLQLTPKADLTIGDEVNASFIMQHIYVNTITTVDNKEPQRCEHKVKVFLNLGKIVGCE